MKYAGGTFSGYKSTFCAAEITVVGHLCSYEGRKPETDRVKVIDNWDLVKISVLNSPPGIPTGIRRTAGFPLQSG